MAFQPHVGVYKTAKNHPDLLQDVIGSSQESGNLDKFMHDIICMDGTDNISLDSNSAAMAE